MKKKILLIIVLCFASISIGFSQNMKKNPLSASISYDLNPWNSANLQIGYMTGENWEILGKFSVDKYFAGINYYYFNKNNNKLKSSIGFLLGAVNDTSVISFSEINPQGIDTNIYIATIRVPVQLNYHFTDQIYLRTEYSLNGGTHPERYSSDPSYTNINGDDLYFSFEIGFGYRF